MWHFFHRTSKSLIFYYLVCIYLYLPLFRCLFTCIYRCSGVYLPVFSTVQVFIYLQVADDAEWFRSVQSTGGGGWQLMGSANQKVSCCRVTAAFCADITELREADIILDPALLSTGEHLQSWEQKLLLWKSSMSLTEPELKQFDKNTLSWSEVRGQIRLSEVLKPRPLFDWQVSVINDTNEGEYSVLHSELTVDRTTCFTSESINWLVDWQKNTYLIINNKRIN